MGQPAEANALSARLMTLFEQLPVKTRKKLNYGELQAVSGAVIIQDRIHNAYSQCAHIITELQRFKRSEGYCGGEPSCLVYTGKGEKRGDTLCSSCKALAKQRREGVSQMKRRQTEYGRLRAKERALEKAERARRGS